MLLFLFKFLVWLVVSAVRSYEEVGDEDMENFVDASTPGNTRKSTGQAERLYSDWRKWKIERHPATVMHAAVLYQNRRRRGKKTGGGGVRRRGLIPQ